MAEIGIIDAWAQLPLRGDQLVPEVHRLLERCAAEARALQLPEAAMENFLRTNALRVFGVS